MWQYAFHCAAARSNWKLVGSQLANFGQSEVYDQFPNNAATRPTHVGIHDKKPVLWNLNLSLNAILQTVVRSAKGRKIMVFWTKRSHTHGAVKCPRFVVFMLCCMSGSDLMAPIWKRSLGQLPSIDCQHSKPSLILTVRTDTARKQDIQLESENQALLN